MGRGGEGSERRPGERERKEGGRDQGTSNTRSLARLSLSLSLRFQRESRVYEERVPSHSVFGVPSWVGLAASLSINRANRRNIFGPIFDFISFSFKATVSGPILLRQRSLSPIRHGPFLRREEDGEGRG